MKGLAAILMLLLSFPVFADYTYDTGVTLQKGQFVVISVDGKDKLVYNVVLDGEKLSLTVVDKMQGHVITARIYDSNIDVINTLIIK
jgi:hypothetical protein